ncbi:MAG: hypothetical protein JF593_12525 [Novosphingobium sp.]|nr:hypothetical protein [Novosphingobium sp.]
MLRNRAAAALLALAACSSGGKDKADDAYPARLPMPQPRAPVVMPTQPPGAQWTAGVGLVQFGVPGQQPLLLIACEQQGSPGARLRVERLVTAEPWAKAFFALVGARHVVHLPVDATTGDSGMHWVGTFAAADPQLDVFADGAPIVATIPGGGTLTLPGSAEEARLVTDCRRGAAPVASPAATAQSLPNLPSNPAVSPAAR